MYYITKKKSTFALRTLASATTAMRTLWIRLVDPTTAIGMSRIPAGSPDCDDEHDAWWVYYVVPEGFVDLGGPNISSSCGRIFTFYPNNFGGFALRTATTSTTVRTTFILVVMSITTIGMSRIPTGFIGSPDVTDAIMPFSIAYEITSNGSVNGPDTNSDSYGIFISMIYNKCDIDILYIINSFYFLEVFKYET